MAAQGGPTSPDGDSKPCRYFRSTGECIVGDNCRFSHDPASPSQAPSSPVAPNPTVAEFQPSAGVPNFRPAAAAFSFKEFKPSGAGPSLTAPEFLPSASSPEFQPSVPTPTAAVPPLQQALAPQPAAAFHPRPVHAAAPPQQSHHHQPHQPHHHQQHQQHFQGQHHSHYQHHSQQVAAGPAMYHQGGMDAMQYPGVLPHIAREPPMSGARRTQYFMSEDLRRELLTRQIASELQLETHDPQAPEVVDNYHSLIPLEPINLEQGNALPYPSVNYKAFCMADGLPYALRRIVGFRLTEQKAMTCVDAWKTVRHPNLINLREVFTTKDYKDHSVVFAYDYHPNCDTLHYRHFATGLGPLPEPLLWSYIIQITGALRAIHAANLTVRVMDPTKVLVTSRSRILLSCCCIYDVLQFDEISKQPHIMSRFQAEDLMMLGRLILGLACGSMGAASREAYAQSMKIVSARCSEDLFNVIRYLLGPLPPGRTSKTVNDLMPMIGARFYIESETLLRHSDRLESEMGKELHNGRLFRIMSKLMFVTGRAAKSEETGDDFLLRLLNDYVFHQVHPETGQPWVDLGHVVQCLNKLDVGSAERVCLMSADEKNVMVVSYADLKRCLATSFNRLCGTSGPHSAI